jgi:hypothetical protein
MEMRKINYIFPLINIFDLLLMILKIYILKALFQKNLIFLKEEGFFLKEIKFYQNVNFIYIQNFLNMN